MKVTRNGDAAFTAEFESEQELREEHRTNLVHNALKLPAPTSVPLYTNLQLTLLGPAGAEANVKATVVALLPDGLALAIEGDAAALLEQLLASDNPKTENAWDRMRSLSQMEKLLLAVKADRSERAVLLQDNDPRVLLSVLRNPRITIDEVARLAKSSYLNFQIADVIVKTGQWMSSLDVKIALVNNARTPQQFALRILPSLPVTEIRNIARGGTSMALKQAALKLMQGRV
jgi:hypothetical protein